MRDDSHRPIGWYTDENDLRRFWDGETWLVPQDESQSPNDAEMGTNESKRVPPRKKRRMTRILIATGVALALVGGSLFAVISVREHQAKEEAKVLAAEAAEEAKAAQAVKDAEAAELAEEQEREAKASQAAADAREAAAKKSRDAATAENESWDEHMTSGEAGNVWEVMETGSLYFRYGDSSQFECGHWDCLMVEVVSTKGCPGGVYVEASIENSGGAVVGWTNVRIGALNAEQVGADLLEDTGGMGSSFNVTKVNCR